MSVCVCVVDFCFAKPQNNTGYMKNGSARPNVVKELRIPFIMVSLHISPQSFFFSPFICCKHNAWKVFGCFFGAHTAKAGHIHIESWTHIHTRSPNENKVGGKMGEAKSMKTRQSKWVRASMFFQWIFVAVGVVLFSAMFPCDVRIIPKDFICCFHILFIKNLYSTMCSVHKFIGRERQRARTDAKKVKSMFTWSKNCETNVRAPRFSEILLLFYYPVSVLFCSRIFIYTLHYRQVNVNNIGSGEWRHCPKWLRQKQRRKRI